MALSGVNFGNLDSAEIIDKVQKLLPENTYTKIDINSGQHHFADGSGALQGKKITLSRENSYYLVYDIFLLFAKSLVGSNSERTSDIDAIYKHFIKDPSFRRQEQIINAFYQFKKITIFGSDDGKHFDRRIEDHPVMGYAQALCSPLNSIVKSLIKVSEVTTTICMGVSFFSALRKS